MSWYFPVWIFVVFFLLGSMMWSLHRTNRRLVRLLTDLNAAGGQTLDGMSHVVHCLVFRLSPRGHVDLSKEEWKKADEGSVEVYRHEDGTVRILAK
jgi:hypothetical protein